MEGYGMTEAHCNISCNPIEGERKIGTVGIPVPYTKLKLIKRDGDRRKLIECNTGEVGEICVSGPGVLSGKTYTDPGKNKELYFEDINLEVNKKITKKLKIKR